MQKLRRKLTYANVVATLALIVAVAGGSTAVAVTVNAARKKSDVNKKGNIRAGRVTAKKLADGNVIAAKLAGIDIVQGSGADRANADCPSGERLLAGGAKINSGPPGAALIDSAPSGNRWEAITNTGPADVTAYAICLR